MKILITGHQGFIGSHLIEELGKEHKVFGVDIKSGFDIRKHEFKEGGFDVIFHAAADASIPKSFENPVESFTHNVLGTLMILEFARRTKAKVVFSSSSSVYELMSPYSWHKGVCEDYLKFYWTLGVKSCALRYFNVFGERQELANGGYKLALSVFLNQLKNNEPFTIYGSGEQRRDFVYVKDVVEANLKAAKWLETAEQFEVFDVGTGINHSILEVADMIKKGHPKVFLPPRIEPFENKADILKTKNWLDWTPKMELSKWLKSAL